WRWSASAVAEDAAQQRVGDDAAPSNPGRIEIQRSHAAGRPHRQYPPLARCGRRSGDTLQPGNAHESRPSASTSLALTALPTVRGSIDTKPRASRRVCRLSASFNKEFLTRRHCPRIVLGITAVVPMAELGQDGSARSRISYAALCLEKTNSDVRAFLAPRQLRILAKSSALAVSQLNSDLK